jgi:hypothetical protein
MKKIIFVLIMTASVLCIPVSVGFAQPYDITEATGDLQVIAESLSNLFGPNIGSMTFLGDPVGYSTVPHFAIGIAGGAALVPASSINSGSSAQLDLGDLSYLPLPAVGAVGKANIKGFELGLKVAGIPTIQAGGAQVNSLILGGKVRYRLLDKKFVLVRLGASVGGFYEYTTGNVTFVDQTTMPVYEDVDTDGQDEHIANLNTTAGFASEWSGSTVGGEAQVNAKILFFNIFAGARLSKSFGNAKTVMDGVTSLTAQPGYGAFVTDDPGTATSISTEAGPSGVDTTAFGGVEFKILPVTVAARGSYNIKSENYTVDAGARLQF